MTKFINNDQKCSKHDVFEHLFLSQPTALITRLIATKH